MMPLPDALKETLVLVGRATTTDQLAERIPGISRNAQNNRLERLRAFGLITRERNGKHWIYSRGRFSLKTGRGQKEAR